MKFRFISKIKIHSKAKTWILDSLSADRTREVPFYQHFQTHQMIVFFEFK